MAYFRTLKVNEAEDDSDWAEPGSKMLSAGNYDNRPTRVWAELGSKLAMIGPSYYKYVTKLVKKIKLNTTRILRTLFHSFFNSNLTHL